MNDMKQVIVPKSDQLNADDLISGPITIRVAGVSIRSSGEQPISISYDGDGGKPYKPCKSMCRVMVAAWGADSKQYTGRSMTLYRDPSVKWGGMDVGGIRISHMSDIDSSMTMALTMTKQSRKPFTVKPLAKESAGTQRTHAAELPSDALASTSPADPMTDDTIAAEVGVLVKKGSYDLALDLLRGMKDEKRRSEAEERIRARTR